MASDDEQESALQNNIRVKGKNSYYYAHKPRSDHVAAWDGKSEPKLLSTGAPAAASLIQETPTVVITNYAWSDAKKRVKIYVDLQGIEKISDEQIDFTWAASEISLRVKDFDKKNLLLVLPLYETIQDASLRRKENRLVLSLTKEKEISWHQLKK